MNIDRIHWIHLWRWLGLMALALLLLIPAAPVKADAGPKPGMMFRFIFEVPDISLLGGDLLVCQQSDCADGTPLKEAGPQRFHCDVQTCSTVLYGSSPYYMLNLKFSDKTRASQVFTKARFNADYRVTVRANDLSVQENTFNFGWQDCLCGGMSLTLLLETLIAGVFASTLGLSRALVGWVPLASLFTLPVVWLGFPLLPVAPLVSTGLAEGFAVLAEAAIIYFAVQRAVTFRMVLLLSIVMNAVSFIAGWVI